MLREFGVGIRSHVVQLGGIPEAPLEKQWDEICSIVSDSPLNCADENVEQQMMTAIDSAKENGDTLGGVFEIVAKNLVTGIGAHTSWSEKLDGRIAQGVMSIHAVKAVEIGTAVANANKPGSEVHDEIFYETGDRRQETGDSLLSPDSRLKSRFVRRTNRAGGLEGGITNGEELRVRGYLKPISTLKKPLRSVDIDTKKEDAAAYERSDVTVVPAAGVIGESMLAIVLANAYREKFGGDSLDEMMRNFQGYLESLKAY